MNFEKARLNMIEQQVRAWDVLDERVLAALAEVSREDFVPPLYRKLAFADMAIPLGHGQCMMPPREEGRLLQELAIKPTDNILEIGTGSGHLTALLALLGGSVTSLDINADFSASAGERIKELGITHIKFMVEDAVRYCTNTTTNFDVICIAVSVPQKPQLFLDHLAVGGRLFAIVGQAPAMRATLFTRAAAGEFQEQGLYETVAPELLTLSTSPSFEF